MANWFLEKSVTFKTGSAELTDEGKDALKPKKSKFSYTLFPKRIAKAFPCLVD